VGPRRGRRAASRLAPALELETVVAHARHEASLARHLLLHWTRECSSRWAAESVAKLLEAAHSGSFV